MSIVTYPEAPYTDAFDKLAFFDNQTHRDWWQRILENTLFTFKPTTLESMEGCRELVEQGMMKLVVYAQNDYSHFEWTELGLSTIALRLL